VDALWDPFRFEFFRNGLLVATVAGALCGLTGTYVVVRRMSYIGHGLSHAVFGGAAVAAVVGVDFFLGAGVWGIISALLVARVARRGVVGSDAAIGVVTTASFAFGLALFALAGRARRGTDALLFGSVLGVDETDIAVVVGIAVVTVVVVVLGYRPLLFSTFDPEVAAVSGLRVDRLDALLMVVLAVVVLATTQVLGVVLVAAALVIPATVARLLTDGFARMLWLSTVIGALCGFVGMIASYHLDIPSGAAIVLVGAALFVVVFGTTGARGRRRVGAAAALGGEAGPPV
jgi:manganese/iron transport system permease protein/iron/zinc/copper transport system permease protein